MSVLNKDDFMSRIKAKVGDDTSDEAMSFIEDMSDTFNDLESRTVDNSGEWEEKYNNAVQEKDNLDKEWREKYKARFFDGVENGSEAIVDQTEGVKDDGKEVTFDDLFTEREGYDIIIVSVETFSDAVNYLETE